MSAAVLVVTPSPVRAALVQFAYALWVQVASFVGFLRVSRASMLPVDDGECESVPPTLRSPGSAKP